VPGADIAEWQLLNFPIFSNFAATIEYVMHFPTSTIRRYIRIDLRLCSDLRFGCEFPQTLQNNHKRSALFTREFALFLPLSVLQIPFRVFAY
jgi:hypothetical protein